MRIQKIKCTRSNALRKEHKRRDMNDSQNALPFSLFGVGGEESLFSGASGGSVGDVTGDSLFIF
jgi:hypothetical protein